MIQENIDQNQIPPISSSRKYIWIILIVFVLLMIVVLIWALNNKKNKLKTESAKQVELVLTVSNVQNALLVDSKISFPEIENEKMVDISSINKDIKALIIRDSENKNLQVSKVTYINGKVGQIIKFSVDKPLFSHYWAVGGMVTSGGWKKLFGSRGTLATILEIENKNLTVRILGSELTKDSTDVYVQTIQK